MGGGPVTGNGNGGDYGRRLDRIEGTLYYGNGKDAITIRLDRQEVHLRNLENQRLGRRDSIALYSAVAFGLVGAIQTVVSFWNWMQA